MCNNIFCSWLILKMFSGEIEVAEALRDVCGYCQENFEYYERNCMRLLKVYAYAICHKIKE
jgi:hypothetical protein